ncbi:NADH-quinone oxidoreductase subunit J, partial [Carbonactinospora thermoautotrophica]|nr:NADH-quinone oxidoreductase subunit J [Carbonactinospora thermoautotrophica]
MTAAAPQTGTGEAVTFWILAPVAVLAAIGMVVVRKAVHSALLLALVMLCLAVFYLTQ